MLARNEVEEGRQGPHTQDFDMENTAGCLEMTLSNLPSIITPAAKRRRGCEGRSGRRKSFGDYRSDLGEIIRRWDAAVCVLGGADRSERHSVK